MERTTISQKTCAICHSVIDGDFAGLEVKDSGPGIPANLQQRIFDPFFTTKDIGKGSGLGLSMVQGILIKNNAHLLIETGPEQGCSFRLRTRKRLLRKTSFPHLTYPRPSTGIFG